MRSGIASGTRRKIDRQSYRDFTVYTYVSIIIPHGSIHVVRYIKAHHNRHVQIKSNFRPKTYEEGGYEHVRSGPYFRPQSAAGQDSL
jgi:hypothetical protein